MVTILKEPAVARALGGVVQIRVFTIVAALEPDPADGNGRESDSEHNDHDHPLVMAIPPIDVSYRNEQGRSLD